MPEFWEAAFVEKQMMWGRDPARSALVAAELFSRLGAKSVLIPGIGYGRNAQPFLARGMSVTGIEISETAIALARAELGLEVPIHHGTVSAMPYDHARYDGIFCFGLLYLLDGEARAKLVRDSWAQLAPGGAMMFTVVSKASPMYGRGTKLADEWYEPLPGLTMYFYDEESAAHELEGCGPIEVSTIDEPAHGSSLPFLNIVCRKP